MIIIIERLYDRAGVHINNKEVHPSRHLTSHAILLSIKCKPTSVTSAGLPAVCLPKEDSAHTDAAQRQLMARNDGRAEATCYSG